MNYFVQQLVANGIHPDVIYFLLVVSFVVMIATIVRHIFGIKILGMYAFVSMTFVIAFLLRAYSSLSIALSVGILIFIYFFSYFVKRLTIKLNLHYFSRISVVITMISFFLLILLFLAGQNNDLVNNLKLNEITPFAIVIAVMLSEHYSSHQTQKGYKTSRKMFLNTLTLSILTGTLISWDTFELYSLRYPYTVLAFMLVSLLAGRYKGLRVSEILRFSKIQDNSRD